MFAITAVEFGPPTGLLNPHQRRNIYNGDAQPFCGNQEIRQRLLMERIDFGEDYVLRIMPAEYYLAVEPPEAGLCMSAEKLVERLVQGGKHPR